MNLYDARTIADVAVELWDARRASDDDKRPIDYLPEAFELLSAAERLLPPPAVLPGIPFPGFKAPVSEEDALELVRKFAQALREGMDPDQGKGWTP